MSKLTPAEEAQLRFLRTQVDTCEREAARTEMHRDVSADLLRARRELREYVRSLREEGRDV
jgi:hypothetical protein